MDIKPVEELWDTWNVRMLVIVSLLTQVFLSLLAPSRKQRGGKLFIKIIIWSTYLFADWVAIFTIGVIMQHRNRTDFQTLWAPFLLLHLGGPDTITSFSLEDNGFWLRHLLGLILQVGSTLYVIGQSWLHNKYWLPASLILIAGTIKYVERTLSFYFASIDHFGDNGGNDDSSETTTTTKQVYSWKEKLKYWVLCRPYQMQFVTRGADESYLEQGWRCVRNGTQLSNFILSKEPYKGTIKFLLVGLLISPHRRDLTRICFLRKSSKDILQMLEIELSLLYEALHTKFPLFESKLGKILRLLDLSCILGALLSFILLVNMRGGADFDSGKLEVCLTYALLIGAIIIDLVSVWLASSSDFHTFQPYNWVFEKYLKKIKSMCNFNDGNLMKIINSRRPKYWSRQVPQLSFTKYYVDADHTIWSYKFSDFPHLRLTLGDILRRKKYLSSEKLDENHNVLWDFIVHELKEKAERPEAVEDGKRLCQRKGEGPILQWFWKIDDEQDLEKQAQTERKLIWRFWHLDYTESFLAWHIATELCLYEKDDEEDDNTKDYRSISKVISCYMFYLFEMQDPLIASVFIDSKVLREATCNHVRFVLNKYKTTLNNAKEEGDSGMQYTDVSDHQKKKNVYEQGRRVHAEKADSGKLFAMDEHYLREEAPPKTALENARKLVDELWQEGGGAFPWKLMSQVWVEIMCYAAINCRSIVHAQQPSQGGQLLTFVWLLMNHLGLGIRSYTTLDLGGEDVEEEEEEKSSPVEKNLYTINSSFNVQSQYHVNMFPWSMY